MCADGLRAHEEEAGPEEQAAAAPRRHSANVQLWGLHQAREEGVCQLRGAGTGVLRCT